MEELMQLELRPGDFFASKNPHGLGKLIIFAQKMKSQDMKAEYSHVGFITDKQADTLECVGRIKQQNLFKEYAGEKVIIARWKYMDEAAYKRGYEAIKDQIGKKYPWWRLALHLVGLARFIYAFRIPVCSEFEDAFEWGCGIQTLSQGHSWGVTPDFKVDEWRRAKDIDIIFEGILPSHM